MSHTTDPGAIQDEKLTAKEADLLVRAMTGYSFQLSACYLSPSEKSACKRLVKKGYMTNIMDTFFRATDSGRERATRIY